MDIVLIPVDKDRDVPKFLIGLVEKQRADRRASTFRPGRTPQESRYKYVLEKMGTPPEDIDRLAEECCREAAKFMEGVFKVPSQEELDALNKARKEQFDKATRGFNGR